MPKTVSQGASGPEVRTLQQALNAVSDGALPALVADGLFGAKTLARVREFQGHRALAVDGIVGPITWGELLLDATEVPEREGCDCGNFDRHNLSLAKTIQQDFLQGRPAGQGSLLAPAMRPFFASGQRRLNAAPRGGGAVATLAPASSGFRFLDAAQKAKAKTVYGDSLDFSRILVSDKAGLQNRPFTIAFPDGAQVVQVMNCGTFTPDDDTLIHELAHVWQSQHHSDPFRFMVNAVDCQAGAVVANGAEVFNDASVLLHHSHPVQFPFSAYAYMPGLGLAGYAAEQSAHAIEHGDKKLRAHVKSITVNAVDPACVAGLSLLQFSDRRVRGVVF